MDALSIFFLILGLIVGFFVAWFIISRQKWGDKSKVFNAQWETKLKELEKNYEIQLEKSKTANAELSREWEVRYTKDLEELKRLFKESEKNIRKKSVSSSRRSLVGRFIEKFVPFLSEIKYAPADLHFLGQPVDYIVFEGLESDKIKRVTFLEVKTGESKLTPREKSLKETIQKRRVTWKEIRVDTSSKKTPDEEIASEEEVVKDLYKDIDNKIASVRQAAFKEK